MMGLMKRGTDGDGPMDNKRFKFDVTVYENEVRLLIPSKGAGGVIGRGGDNIKRLRTTMNADIAIPDSTTPDRIVHISTNGDNIGEIITEVIAKVEEVVVRQKSEARVLVHQSQAGAIIGRAGSKIKELREQTSCEVSVLTECCPMSSDRVVIIEGDLPRIVRCIMDVMRICKEVPIKGPIRNYDTVNYDPAFAEVYGGYPPDRRGGGGGGRGGRGRGRGSSGLGGPGAGAFGGGGGVRGFARGGMRGGFGRGAYGSGYGGDGYGFGASGPGGYMNQSMGLGPMGLMDDEGAEETVSQFTIPADLAGTIIGKGGDRITRIREECGARIVVNPPEGDSSERVITIKGTPGRIQAAKQLLQQCVKASPAGRRYIQIANS